MPACVARLTKHLPSSVPRTKFGTVQYFLATIRLFATWYMTIRPPRARRGDACTTCRKRKIKCDSKRPICNRCVASGASEDCQYEVAPAKSSMRWLHARVNELEMQVARTQHSEGFTVLDIAFAHSNPSLPYMKHPAAPKPNGWPEKISAGIPLSLGDPLESWVLYNEIPHTIRDGLVPIFLSHRWNCAFEFSLPQLKRTLKLNPASVHPAYLNAICLHACLHSRDSLRRLEPVFLSRTRRALAQSLIDTDGLLDFIRASALLGMYFYYTGRTTVGHHYIAGALRFALACGLHEITSLETPSRHQALLEPANNLVELGDRINLFWMLYANDRAGSIICRLPVAMPDKFAQTMWPYPSAYYEMNYTGDESQAPLALSPDTRNLEKNHCSHRAKAFFLLSMAYELASRARALPDNELPDSLLYDIEFAGTQIVKFGRNLPALSELYLSAECVDETVFPVNAMAIASHHSAAITLYSLIADRDLTSRQRCLDSARIIVEVLTTVNALSLPCVPSLRTALTISWRSAFNVLSREVKLQFPDADAIRFDLDRLLEAMRITARDASYLRPVVDVLVKKVADGS
ncbi:hypothetical protein BOTBODRAFT_26065 [Botryobasidium botryosum FD-172 SS1]|uniref:Zn(2)-C6 fungal-type domain-containing protein n=1 Tax=Botryobasidium botryosum (strain FD-172 SS1) TaxID=930990 RepID=A0A067N0U7_BOTB1|nr:hypothetical protein BOTBODRAFT_26065 [Botryobasidium botryosum FD-172 SS1]